MTVVNSFVADTTISASAMNANFEDIASEITNSLPTDGQKGMTGQFKASSGTVAAPGISFASSTDMGIRRVSATQMNMVISGVDVGTITASGVGDASGNAFSAFPSGTKMLFAQTSAPTGWTKVTTSDNAALRVVSGTAGTGGTANFTDVFTARTIARANLPNVTLTTDSQGAHTHTASGVFNNSTSNIVSAGGGPIGIFGTVETSSNGAHTHTTSSINGGVTQTAVDFAVKYVDVIVATKN